MGLASQQEFNRQLSLPSSNQIEKGLADLRPSCQERGSLQVINFVNVFNLSSSERDSDLSQELHDLNHFEEELSPEEKERVPKDTEYWKLIDHLKSWKNLARNGFGFPEGKVVQLESDYYREGFREQAHQAFQYWKKGLTQEPTLWQIIKALHAAKEQDAISHLIEHFKGKEST